ncbi:MAG: Plug domain-containing protein [Gammaproteobacteria bacterium]
MIHHTRHVLLSAAAATFAALPAFGQEDSAALQEVLVTARYREENLQTTPLAITALTVQDLDERGLANVDDLGLAIPNAFVRQPVSNFGPTQTIGMRGIIQTDFSYAFEPAVGIYIDDVYHGTLTGSSMDLLDLERVEVLRGPQGAACAGPSHAGAGSFAGWHREPPAGVGHYVPQDLPLNAVAGFPKWSPAATMLELAAR